MTSFVYIELDTKPPEIQIFAPSYTTTKIANTIRIEANEPLSDYQEIYAIDSNGIRHDYNFNKAEANLLIGEVSFFDFPLGVATIYAKLQDEVDNISDLVSTTIMIRENLTLLNLTINDSCNEAIVNDKQIDININNSIRNIGINDGQKEVSLNVK